MQEKIRTLIRQQWAGLIALFLVLSGGTALATHPGGANTISSTDIIDNEVKTQDVRDGNMTRDDIRTDAVVTEHIATGAVQSIDVANDTTSGALTGTDIASNSLGGGDIQNPTRSVNLPLGSLVDLTRQRAIDFDSSNSDYSPDFVPGDPDTFVLEYDADPNKEDDSGVASTLFVPQDYASGGSIALRASKVGHTGLDEYLQCNVNVNSSASGGASGGDDSALTTTANNTVYTLSPPATYAAGASVAVFCLVHGESDFTFPDNNVRIHSIEFRYEATQ
jgi:hypothetical protein